MHSLVLRIVAGSALASLCAAAPTLAAEGRAGGKLLLTDGITTVEGSAGGGIASWAVIAGQETNAGVGGAASATLIALPDFTLTSLGGAIGIRDRIELSYARQRFDTRDAGAALGLGKGFTFGQQVFGAKLRLVGDAVWDQDRWLPQISVGVQHRRTTQGAVIAAVGGRHDRGTDVYASATKLILSRGLLLNGTVRLTKANQWGLLGFGGDRRDRHTAQFEGSAALLLSPRLAIGGEYRTKPDNLGFAAENDAVDLFAAWALHRHLTLTAAYADLGAIATVRGQRGLFVQLRSAF
ncbi:DUF3034 family protein [Sphingomonas sp. KR1UV-12]|uniref:DUF3034 family protein n=1 Tax=Sphingomonas aurea TaxID=3063994 RepID=A0ABT9EMH4_9SPHN|nr:DUF3034 family protein [Sphingomonas sp. KR1UV-12]MDP1028158.1 DUF3034 family protein [Sphingomonas sp. KR1UV-12]